MKKQKDYPRFAKREEEKRVFIRKLARYLVGEQAAKSVCLSMESTNGNPRSFVRWAGEWADLRGATPLFGYPSVDEAEKTLTEFLA